MSFLTWISQNNSEAFMGAVMCLIALGITCHMIVRLVRGFPHPSTRIGAPMDQGGFCDCDCHDCECDCLSGLRETARRLEAVIHERDRAREWNKSLAKTADIEAENSAELAEALRECDWMLGGVPHKTNSDIHKIVIAALAKHSA